MKLAEWLDCTTKPTSMVYAVRGMLSPRQRQLLACGLCRLIPATSLEPWELEALQAAEQFAEGDLPAAEYRSVAERVRATGDDLEIRQSVHGDVAEERIAAATAVLCACGTADVYRSLPSLLTYVMRFDQLTAAKGTKSKSKALMLSRQCDVIREILCMPKSPYRRFSVATGSGVFFGSQMLLIPETPRSLAAAIHAEQAFDRLPILADAMEDAGCTDERFLNHLREPREHCRGCWALDLVLGRS